MQIDDAEVQRIREEAAGELKLLIDVYDKGRRDPDMWHKGLIFLATKLARVGCLDDADGILSLFPIDGSYFAKTMPTEMARDGGFAIVVMELCSILVDHGLVQVEYKSEDPPLTHFIIGKA